MNTGGRDVAVKDWNGGQVVVFWCILVVAAFLLALGLAIATGIAQLEDILFVAVLIFAVLFAIPGLVVTWKWLGRRPSSN